MTMTNRWDGRLHPQQDDIRTIETGMASCPVTQGIPNMGATIYMERGRARYLHNIVPVNLLDGMGAQARVMLRTPSIAPGESVQAITHHLVMHARAQVKKAFGQIAARI